MRFVVVSQLAFWNNFVMSYNGNSSLPNVSCNQNESWNHNSDVLLLDLARSKDFPFLKKGNGAQVVIGNFHIKYVHSPSLLLFPRLGSVAPLCAHNTITVFTHCIYLMDTCAYILHIEWNLSVSKTDL